MTIVELENIVKWMKLFRLIYSLAWKSAVVVCVPPETFSFPDLGTAETCAVRPPVSSDCPCWSTTVAPFVFLTYPKPWGTPFDLLLAIFDDELLFLE